MAKTADSEDTSNIDPLITETSLTGSNFSLLDDGFEQTVATGTPIDLIIDDSCGMSGIGAAEGPESPVDPNRIRNLEEEQEILTTSLMALTSHFAQVQFRLRQIVDAPVDDRDNLLKNLEEFAFRGIPEITGNLNPAESGEVISSLERARQRQFDLIDRLKKQLTELEKFAYESGAPGVLPQSILVEKQKVIIDELKNKLNLNVNEFDLPQLSAEDLKIQVDTAIGEFVGPLKMKEQLVAQLKTQITDLERFIAFLQCETADDLKFNSMMTASNDDHDDTGERRAQAPYNSYSAKKKHSSKIGNNNKFNRAMILTHNQNGEDIQVNCNDEAGMDMGRNIPSKASPCGINGRGKVQMNGTTNISGLSTTTEDSSESLNSKAHSLMDKAATLLQMFAITQFGCGSSRFQKNTLKKSSKINHWGDIRAQLEVDIQELVSLAIALKRDRDKFQQKNESSDMLTTINGSAGSIITNSPTTIATKAASVVNCSKNVNSSNNISITKQFIDIYDDYTSDSDDDINGGGGYCKTPINKLPIIPSTMETYSMTNVEMTSMVRRNFAVTLQKLIQHGLRAESDTAGSLVPFIGCFNVLQSPANDDSNSSISDDYISSSSSSSSGYSSNSGMGGGINGRRQMHAWDLILEYYHLKNGEKYNETPARKLSQSFNLEIVGGNAVSNKQSLLSAIGSIIAMHLPYKRSYNSHFKAFVCAALNSHKLVAWLNLIFQCNELVSTFYTSWSYVARTGFRDSLRSIDRLTKYDFDLPVDLAIRQFQNIKDVFM